MTATPSRKASDRAQVGIGTLIVFIAMVLVAAIAAGVLISTAGFLQSSAERTGQQSSEQVTDRLQVVYTYGHDIYTRADTIKYAELTVKLAPGSGNVDLDNTTVQIVGERGSVHLTSGAVYGGTLAPNSTTFWVSTIQDDDESISDSGVLNDPADRARIRIDVDDAFAGVDTVVNNGHGLGGGRVDYRSVEHPIRRDDGRPTHRSGDAVGEFGRDAVTELDTLSPGKRRPRRSVMTAVSAPPR